MRYGAGTVRRCWESLGAEYSNQRRESGNVIIRCNSWFHFIISFYDTYQCAVTNTSALLWPLKNNCQLNHKLNGLCHHGNKEWAPYFSFPMPNDHLRLLVTLITGVIMLISGFWIGERLLRVLLRPSVHEIINVLANKTAEFNWI